MSIALVVSGVVAAMDLYLQVHGCCSTVCIELYISERREAI